jgi:hypothetical protein
MAGTIQCAPSSEEGPVGYVLAAPHDGYDRHTGALVAQILEELDWGWVVATGYRSYRSLEWYDVNRPTARPWVRDSFGKSRPDPEAEAVYQAYQEALCQAGRVEAGQPLELLVELHGNNRQAELEGEQVRVRVIELATTGFQERELKRLASRFRRLVKRHVPEELRVPLAIDALDPEYEFEGARIPFKYNATGAKESGALRPECTRRALHFELPGCVRADAEVRAAYAKVFVELLEALTE